MSPADSLERLAARVREEGPPLMTRDAGDLVASGTGPTALGELAASGPRTSSRGSEYAYVVEAVREGYLCHYGSSRVLADPDPDLALLAGDLFYAIGIRGLADLDDLESTGILSDLIRVAADLQAAGRADLAEILWLGQIVALSCGKDDSYDDRLAALEAGQEGAGEALAGWSLDKATTSGLGREFGTAQTAIDSGPSNF